MVVLSATWLATAQEGGRPAAKPAKILAEVELDHDADRPVIPVVIGGERYPFVVDTGAFTSCIDPLLRKHLGERIGRTVEKSDDGKWAQTVDEFAAPHAFVGKCLLLESGGIQCRDMGPFRRLDGGSYLGIAGVDFLKRYVVRIDFDAGTLQLLSRVPPQAGQLVAIDVDDFGHPVLTANVGNQEEQFILDTGSDLSMTLGSHLFLQLVAQGSISHERDSGIMTVDGPQPSVSGRLSTLRIGPFEHRDLVVSMDGQNTLGVGYLSRYALTLDLNSRKLFLKPGKAFERADTRDLSGMRIVQEGKDFVVDQVVPFGPAVRAGLQPDDVLVRIDGLEPPAWSLRSLKRFFAEGDGKSVRMAVRRDGKLVQATLSLREFIQERLRAAEYFRLDTSAE